MNQHLKSQLKLNQITKRAFSKRVERSFFFVVSGGQKRACGSNGDFSGFVIYVILETLAIQGKKRF
jgi:hypothetical protein